MPFGALTEIHWLTWVCVQRPAPNLLANAVGPSCSATILRMFWVRAVLASMAGIVGRMTESVNSRKGVDGA